MGRDRKRVLIFAAISIVLTIAGTLAMDWYRVAFDATDGGFGKISIAIDLRSLHTCTAIRVCTTAPLTPLPGMFPTLAAVTLWSSLAFLGLVAFQAGVRLLTGNANDSLAKFGYMFALTAISIAFATAYLFGPETEGPVVGMAAELGLTLHRTWGPLTLIVGLVAGFATLYMAVAPAPAELGDSYKPITLVSLRPLDEASDVQSDLPLAARTATRPMRPSGTRLGTRPPTAPGSITRPPTGPGSITRPPTGPGSITRPPTGPGNITRPPTGQLVGAARPPSGQLPLIGPSTLTAEIQIVGDPLEMPEMPVTSERDTIRSEPLLERDAPSQQITRREGNAPTARRDASGPIAARREGSGPLSTAREASGPVATRRESSGPLATRRESSGPLATRRESSGPLATRREGSGPLVSREGSGPIASQRDGSGPLRTGPALARRDVTAQPQVKREATGAVPAARRETTSVIPTARRETTGVVPTKRETTGVIPTARRETTGVIPTARRETTGVIPTARRETPGVVPVGPRTKSGPITPIPDHLRNRLRYVAITVELTGGGIDARREDGTSRLVLWRDLVGAVARRLPAAYDGITFVDIVSTAGSTLRIVPWTRLTGDAIDGEGDERPRGIIEHILTRCPGAKLDPATRSFLETGVAAQLRDIETLHAHDARLA